MSEWAAKRFWTTASVAPEESGFAVRLDSRALRTPAKQPLIVPTQGLAEVIVAEWDRQGERVDPQTMPFTQSANAANDKVKTQHAEVADMLAAYGDSDLLCYRAESPDGLVARQQEAWDPLLAWASDALDSPLRSVTGVIHAPQDPASLQKLSTQVHALDAFQLTAFHDLVSLSGSLVIGFAAARGYAPPQRLWQISRIDEQWQIEQWGNDDEAEAAAVIKQAAFLHAHDFYVMSA